MKEHITSVAIRHERDVVLARRRARQIGELLGFNRQDQTRIATATSELARNAYQYAGGGEVSYCVERASDPASFLITIADGGPGIDDLATVLDGRYHSDTGLGIGIVGVRRLMDHFAIESDAERGTTVVVGKVVRTALPASLDPAAMGTALETATGHDAFSEMQRQNQDLIHALGELGRREQELEVLNHALEERAQAARVLSDVADGIALIGSDGLIHQWNRAAATILGLPADDVMGKPVAEVVPGWETFAGRVPVSEPGVREPAPAVAPIQLDGRELWLSGTGVAVPEGTVYAFRNVTKERTLERIRNELIATVSHELRTPLASVCGAAITLQRTDIELTADLRAALLSVIVSESGRLERIAEGILVSSRLQAGEVPLAVEGVDLAQIAHRTLAAARAGLTHPRNIVLTVVEEMPLVDCDPERLAQVLTNLVDNAVKYSPDGGTIDVALTYDDGVARYEVSDQGLGIPAEEHDRIFERFYRLDPDLESAISGTGLGLYISRELVRLMGGKIDVRSKLGEGATFVVELPVAASRLDAG